MHVVQCKSLGRAFALAVLLQHKGYPTDWSVVNGAARVTTMAPYRVVLRWLAFTTHATEDSNAT